MAAGLVEVARERTPSFIGHGRIDWRSGDMLDPSLGTFAHVVAMDSLIHYQPADLADALSQLAERTTHSILFTFAPRTALLQTMYTIGKAFPRSDRSPAIVPTLEWEIRHRLAQLPGWRIGRTKRISSGFYTSQALELVRQG